MNWKSKIAILIGFLLAGSQAFAQDASQGDFFKVLNFVKVDTGLPSVKPILPKPLNGGGEQEVNFGKVSFSITNDPIINLPDWTDIPSPNDNRNLIKQTLLSSTKTSTRFSTHLPAFSEPRSFVCDLEDFLSEKTKVLIDIGPE